MLSKLLSQFLAPPIKRDAPYKGNIHLLYISKAFGFTIVPNLSPPCLGSHGEPVARLDYCLEGQ